MTHVANTKLGKSRPRESKVKTELTKFRGTRGVELEEKLYMENDLSVSSKLRRRHVKNWCPPLFV
jgi:hypothetical protein